MKKIKSFFYTSIILGSLFINMFGIHAAIEEAPILQDPVQFVTVKKEDFELHGAPFHIVIKHIEHVPNVEVERQINTMIDRYINDTIAKMKKEIESVAEAGHEVMTEIGMNVTDYYFDQNLASFSLDFLQIMASSYEKKEYHTIDLATGKELLIEHWLGKDYARIVKDEIVKQINQQNKENGSDLYFMDDVKKLKIEPNQSYYINKDGQVVVTFPKYEIAPGYVGLPEFIMPHNIKEVKH